MEAAEELRKEPFSAKFWRSLGLIALVLGGFFPLVWTILTSLKSETELQAKPITYLPHIWKWDNYVQVFQAKPFLNFFLNSLITSSVSTILCVIIAAMAAYPLARLNIKNKGLIMSSVVVFSMIPVIAMMVPLYKIMTHFSLINTYPALILPYTALSLPVAILTLTAFFTSIPAELESAAMVDGCSKVGALRKIILPLALPGLVTAGILVFVNSWNEFLLALSLNTRLEMRTVSVGVTLYQGEFAFPFALMSAAITIAMIPIIILIIVFQKRIVSGLTAGSVKG